MHCIEDRATRMLMVTRHHVRHILLKHGLTSLSGGAMQAESAFKYGLHIYWSGDDDAFLAHVPDLPGCMVHGATPAEAAANAQDAIALWLDVARENGDPIPEPSRHRALA